MIRHSVEGHRARDSKCTSAVCAESMSWYSQLMTRCLSSMLASGDMSNWYAILRQQWRTGPPGNREISRWAPASGIFSGPRPYARIYFIDNQLTQSADRLSIHRAGGKTPVPPGLGASRMLRGLMLRMRKIFWARADV